VRDLIIFLSVVRDNKGLSLASIKKGTLSRKKQQTAFAPPPPPEKGGVFFYAKIEVQNEKTST